MTTFIEFLKRHIRDLNGSAELVVVSVRLPRWLIDVIDTLVEMKITISRSEFIRQAVLEKLKEVISIWQRRSDYFEE